MGGFWPQFRFDLSSFALKLKLEYRNWKLEEGLSRLEMRTSLEPAAGWLVTAALAAAMNKEAARP